MEEREEIRGVPRCGAGAWIPVEHPSLGYARADWKSATQSRRVGRPALRRNGRFYRRGAREGSGMAAGLMARMGHVLQMNRGAKETTDTPTPLQKGQIWTFQEQLLELNHVGKHLAEIIRRKNPLPGAVRKP